MWGESSGEAVIPMSTWTARTDEDSTPLEPFAFAVAVDSAGKRASIGMASPREDGLWHVELIAAAPRTDWIPDAVEQLRRKHRRAPILIRPASGAGAVAKTLKEKGVKLTPATRRDYQSACGEFEDAVLDDVVRHLGDAILAAAVDAGRKLERDGAWEWDRADVESDITPLEAVTMALHGVRNAILAAKQRRHVPTDPDRFVSNDLATTLRW
jgi:hypothetical protein